jgi:Fur family ferric uptake transcriptional regulator
MPKTSLGTVYRNLGLLAANGVIRKLDVGGSEARFDGNPELHYHVRCIRCERVDNVDDLPDALAPGQLRTFTGYDMVGFRLELIGVCPECQDRPAVGGRGTSLQERN